MKIGDVLRPIDIQNDEPTTNLKLSNIRVSFLIYFETYKESDNYLRT
ncbi:MAG: hypothetical protein CM15mP112_06820 [Flavobacteriales bacterium]|nr:MAG: hypothetical protein CM15mP112_06820 [Flavobacteriales bacterium]